MDRSQGIFYDHNVQKSKIGVSSLKIFDGEDLTYGDRKRIQALQQKDWIEQQIREKQDKLRSEKEAESNFAQQTLELNGMRKALEDDHEFRQKTMQKAYMENNRTLAQEKADREKTAKLIEESDKKNHMDYNTANDFYTENTQTCQSQLAGHRVIPYHWKGMNENQRKDILNEQDKQRRETQNIKNLKKDEEKLYAIQAEHQRKMQIQMEREKVRRKEELARNQKEFNLLKNEEQQIKIKTMYG
jgi:hypothetical protein